MYYDRSIFQIKFLLDISNFNTTCTYEAGPASKSSMSDLVKFVAAVLKEKVAADLEEENKQLRLKNERLENERAKALEHASRNGRVSPVYAAW